MTYDNRINGFGSQGELWFKHKNVTQCLSVRGNFRFPDMNKMIAFLGHGDRSFSHSFLFLSSDVDSTTRWSLRVCTPRKWCYFIVCFVVLCQLSVNRVGYSQNSIVILERSVCPL